MIKEKAYAKVNLFLNVLGKRDDGFHDLEMVMAAVDLHDTLTFCKEKGGLITLTSNKEITLDPKDNLVYKIAKYLMDKYDIRDGVKIHIDKVIPMGGGLAGGSADAAATLRGLNKLWNLNLTLDELSEIGSKFGSDIPFCIYNKLCIASSRGEKLEFLDGKIEFPILLVNPNLNMDTKIVFKELKPNDITNKTINGVVSAIFKNDINKLIKELHNTLEKPAFRLEKRIKEAKESMTSLGLKGVLMSGSGATVFAICEDRKRLQYVMERLSNTNYTKLTNFI